MRTALLLLAAAASLGIADHPSFAKKPTPPTPVVAPAPLNQPGFRSLSVDTFVLAEYDFAGLDPQGWTTHDITAQIDTFFHVDNFAGVPGYAPLSGTKSLWCGTNTSIGGCPYLTCAPGYGNSWKQTFESIAFPATGDVTLSFQIRHDSEPDYDYTYVEFMDYLNGWVRVASYDGAAGPMLASFAIPASQLPGTVKVRFRFVSDPYWSDEDCLFNTYGAVVIDNISLSDANGQIDFQDFEAEAVGVFTTADGDWSAFATPGYGTLAALYPGTSVLQEDPNHYELGAVWGFFADPSVVNYSCGGHPEQGAVPYQRYGSQYFNNAIWSPQIEWQEDQDGAPIPSTVSGALLEFDVYRDLELDGMIFYKWHVRSFVDGCPGPWKDRGYVYWGAQKDWYRAGFEIGDLVWPGATSIQVALEVWDGCSIWYCFGEECHSHAPLFTNVRVVRVDEWATAVGDVPGPARLEQNIPNPFNPSTEIRYTIARAGPVWLVIYDVTGARVRELVAGRQEPRADGYRVTWDGTDDRGRRVASGVYYYRLVAGEFTQTRKMVLLK
ncbi:MAG: T9SS type A sorting domain-containing protein [Candidatus Krumholzibacteria bacterium]|nr:T9SS type A sorting domain-containing protein [Candidatus Krumholzibacteria bacterium]MDH4335762.1 T9SS type A sorting domain-containing protein [Candidatus Krumholzibacteria bacterium]MDH5269288.1 T9SS type A sorting domain-containing protein [Candidatus Krumholzibacteria bacterium]